MISMILRPYQIKLVTDLRNNIGAHKKVLGAMATGGGKTAVFISIAQSALSKGRTVLVITESRKIFTQIAAEIKQADEIRPAVKNIGIHRGRCYIAMAQTLVRRPGMIEKFKFLKDNLLIINDEAHINTATKLLEQIPDALLLGFTATPQGRHLKKLYSQCVVGPQPDELVRLGFLSPYRHFARVGADTDKLVIENGEFTEESQKEAFGTAALYEGIANDLRKFTFEKCMIFCASIAHCEQVYERLTLLEFNCVRIHSKRSREEDATDMFNFKMGNINICVSVGSLTKGFDWPPVDLIVLDRATTSTALYLQMIGRGSRIWQGKKNFTVLDYGENYKYHGLWDQDREWQTIWNSAREKKDGVSPIKLCPNCDYLCKQSDKLCPNCGHEFEVNKEGEEEARKKEGELIEITKNWSGRKISEFDPNELAIYARIRNKKPYAIRIASSHYQHGKTKYLVDFAQAMNYKVAWAHMKMNEIDRSENKIDFFDFTFP